MSGTILSSTYIVQNSFEPCPHVSILRKRDNGHLIRSVLRVPEIKHKGPKERYTEWI